MSDSAIDSASALSGDRRSVSRFFNALEDRRPGPAAEAARALDEVFSKSLGRGHLIGVTGPPGAGKSTLVSRLIAVHRAAGRTVGVLAIDPASRRTGGALLGDRIRLEYDAGDPGIYVRSMSNRGDHGGLSDRAFAGAVLLRAAFDVALLETVGVGQAEADVADLVDTTLLVAQPGSGDMLQYLKAGIMETPHVLAVNKSDHPAAPRTLNDLRAALGHFETRAGEWRPSVLACSATRAEGIEELVAELARHREFLAGSAPGGLESARRAQAARWMVQTASGLFGSRGIDRLGGREPAESEALRALAEGGPWGALSRWIARLEA